MAAVGDTGWLFGDVIRTGGGRCASDLGWWWLPYVVAMANDEVPTDSYESNVFVASGDTRSEDRSTDRIGSASFRNGKQQKRPIGRYQIIRRLGAGATAEVFQARHVESGQEVALKVFSGQHHDYEICFAKHVLR
jgi:hypothetical protein